jgi:hypothetical protein
VKRKAFPHGADDEPIRSGDPSALQRIMAKIEDLALSIDKMKAANSIIRRMEKDGADDAAMIAAIVAKNRPFGRCGGTRRRAGKLAMETRIRHSGQPCRNPSPTRAAEVPDADA